MKNEFCRYSSFTPSVINSKHRYQKILITAELLASHFRKDNIGKEIVLSVFSLMRLILPEKILLIYKYIFYNAAHFPDIFNNDIIDCLTKISDNGSVDLFDISTINKIDQYLHVELCHSENANSMFILAFENQRITATILYYLIISIAYVRSDRCQFTAVENITNLRSYHRTLVESLNNVVSLVYFSSHDRIKKEQIELHKKLCRESAVYLYILLNLYFTLPEHYILHIEKNLYTNLDFLCSGSLVRDKQTHSSVYDIVLQRFISAHKIDLSSIKYNSLFLIAATAVLIAMFYTRLK